MTSNSSKQKGNSPSIGLDRLVLSIVANPNYYNGKGEPKFRPEDIDYYNYIVGMIFNSEELTHSKKYKKGTKGGKPIPQRHFLSKDGRLLMDIMNGFQYGKPFIKIGLNPGRLKEDDFPLIIKVIAGLLPPGESYAPLLLNCELSRLELCIDLPNIEPDEITILSMGNHRHTIVDDSTEYNGTRQSRLCAVKYDKRKQLLEEEGIDIGYPLTRIEVRAQERRKSVSDFLEMGEVDFYKKLFHRPILSVQLCMPDSGASTAFGCSQSSGQGSTGTPPFSLQDQEALSPQAVYAKLVQAITALGAATASASRAGAQTPEHSS